MNRRNRRPVRLRAHAVTGMLLLSATLLAPLGEQPRAVMLSLLPDFTTVGVGETARVDLVVSGLGDPVTPIGAQFAQVSFDPTIVALTDAGFGPLLGDPADPLQTNGIIKISLVGVVVVDQASLLSVGELAALQSDTFTLATFDFTGLMAGTSPLTIEHGDLSEAALPASSIVADLAHARITVTDGPRPIPLPATLPLLLPGLLAMRVLRVRAPRTDKH